MAESTKSIDTIDTEAFMNLEDYLEVLIKQGFREVFRASFMGRTWKNSRWNPVEDEYHIYWREPILVAFDTFYGRRVVNGGYVYHNWLPHVEQRGFCLERGYWINGILAGKYDCRVDFIRNIDILEKSGTFISPWVEHKKLWLVNYIERYEEEENAVTEHRLSQLPEEVQKCIRWK